MQLLITAFYLPSIISYSVVVADFNVLLLHTNDMHARFQQTDRYLGMCENDTATNCYGGFARLKMTVDSLKEKAAKEGLPTIFLNAGDSYQGTPYYTFFKWPIVSQFVSMLGIDVMSLGNHEFDDGVEGLAPYIRNVTVPNVCANLDISQEPSLNQPNLTPSFVLTVNGVKIGVIGYLTPDTKFLSNVGKVNILDEITSIRAEAKRLLGQNIQILIAVGHSGYMKDQQIAQEVEEIDLVVGGHSHTFLYSESPEHPLPDPVDIPRGPYPTVITQSSGKKVPVVQAYYGTKYLGYLSLSFDDNGNLKSWSGLPILLNSSFPQDPQVLAALKPYEDELSAKITRIVGYTHVLLDNTGMSCKVGECNMGNIVTDSYVDYVARHYNVTQGWTRAAVALNQAGGIRASINTGTNVNHNGSITLGDVITVLPWGGKIVVKDMPGSVLLQALEFSMKRYEHTLVDHVNEFLQVSGLHVVYDIQKPAGQRVESVEVLCAECDVPEYVPLNVSKTYGVAMPEYLGTGGDGFYMLQNVSVSLFLDDVDYMVFADYIETHSPVYPRVEGRIVIRNVTNGTSGTSGAATNSVSWSVYIFLLYLSINYFVTLE